MKVCVHTKEAHAKSSAWVYYYFKWKKLIVPSTGELVDGLWYYPSDGGCYLAFKRDLHCYVLHYEWNLMVIPSGKPNQRRVYIVWIHIDTVLDSAYLALVRERSSAVSWGYGTGGSEQWERDCTDTRAFPVVMGILVSWSCGFKGVRIITY